MLLLLLLLSLLAGQVNHSRLAHTQWMSVRRSSTWRQRQQQLRRRQQVVVTPSVADGCQRNEQQAATAAAGGERHISSASERAARVASRASSGARRRIERLCARKRAAECPFGVRLLWLCAPRERVTHLGHIDVRSLASSSSSSSNSCVRACVASKLELLAQRETTAATSGDR